MKLCGADQSRVDESHASVAAIPANCEFQLRFSPTHGRFRAYRIFAVGSGAVFSNRVTALGSNAYFQKAPDGTWSFRNKCDYRCLRGSG